jgi:hypothetical protein
MFSCLMLTSAQAQPTCSTTIYVGTKCPSSLPYTCGNYCCTNEAACQSIIGKSKAK